jgi:hypothetical protein
MIAVTFLGFCPIARSQKETHGTTIVVGYSSRFLSIAADSRTINIENGQIGSQCKVAALSNKFVFAAAGTEAIEPPSHPELIWDPYSVARNVFTGSPSSGMELARSWLSVSIVDLQKIVGANLTWFLHGKNSSFDIVNAFFGGLDKKGQITIARADISFDWNTGKFITRAEGFEPRQSVRFGALGLSMIADEFINGQSSRAKKEAIEWETRTHGQPASKQSLNRTIRLVELSIQNYPNNLVAGPITALLLRRTASIEWTDLIQGMQQRIEAIRPK